MIAFSLNLLFRILASWRHTRPETSTFQWPCFWGGLQEDGRLRNIDLIIPNIEFRISPETKQGKGINIHLLVSPHSADHRDRINEALSRLTIKIQGETIPCNATGFRRLGRLVNAALLDDEAAYREGVNQFKVGFEIFRGWLATEEWMRRNCLVALAVGSNDGTAGLRDSGFKAVRTDIEKFADVIFSSNPSDREFWLGEGVLKPDELVKTYGGRKPCLHGSDAHEEAKILKPDKDRYCWIKSDPTFEGLRQIIYEPHERVHIGVEAPERHNSDAVISSLQFQNTCGWFDTDPIVLNPGLVAIIGGKGSGKTALADVIAASAGANVDPEESFLRRASDHLGALSATLHWSSDRTSEYPNTQEWNEQSEVRYLSQKFVERLCAGSEIDDALKQEIEQVVFAHLQEEQTLASSSFEELRERCTGALKGRRSQIKGEISTLNEEISRIDREETQNPKKRNRIRELEKQLAQIKKQYPRIKDEQTKKVFAELERARGEQRVVTEKIVRIRTQQQRLDDVYRRVNQFGKELGDFWIDIKEELTQLGMLPEEVEGFRPVFTGDTKGPFEKLRAGFLKQAESLTGPAIAVTPLPNTLGFWKEEVARVEKLVGWDESKRKRLLLLQGEAGQVEKEIFKLREELLSFETNLLPRRKLAVEKRFDVYLEYFNLLEEEVEILEDLYEPLRASLQSRDEHERKLEMYIRTSVDLEGWANRGEELIDQRKVGPFREAGSLAKEARGHLADSWQAHDTDRIKTGIRHLIDKFRSESSIKDQLRSEYDLVDLADWLFSVEHIELDYALRYDGVDLQKLSPGTKGIVLLILYLAIDTLDQRPLIIDQPDENLDNESIYRILRPYFRIAKARRQVILITHNPNLVVNTDADQVIVASAGRQPSGLPILSYYSGSLESMDLNPSSGRNMRETVCQLLEGGREAFDMRERKYRVTTDNAR